MTEPIVAAPETLLAAPVPVSQADITREIREHHAASARRESAGDTLPATLHDFPPYRSSILRHPTKNPKLVDPETIELLSPAFGQRDVAAIESDLTIQHTGEPLGERMTVRGRVVDSWGRPVAHQLIELWQANSAGRYIHQRDQHPAPSTRTSLGQGAPSRTLAASTSSRRSSPVPIRGRTTSTPGVRRTSTSRSSARRSHSGS